MCFTLAEFAILINLINFVGVMTNNKYCNDMRNEILEITRRLENNKIDAIKAKKELLDLFNVRLSLPDAKYIRSLLPDWAKEAPKGLHPTMYGTCTQRGDQKVIDNINRILGNEA